MAKIHRVGVSLLSESENDSGVQRDLNIIFVHGLRGHPRRTWSGLRPISTTGRNEDIDTRTDNPKKKTFFGLKRSKKETDNKGQASTSPSDIFWPEEYLVPDLPQARVWTYGYDADVIGGLFQANNKNSVSQHGRDFAVKLERDIDNEDPIVFVAHSLGGIITKDALHKSETICKRTRLIVFLGTPHRGSSYAGWGEIASNLASLGLQDSNKRLVQTLEVNGEVLDNIHEEFKTILGKCAIKVHSFQEAKGIFGMKGLDGKVVDNFSSKLDLARDKETVETIDANHMEMARCSSKDDASYRQIHGVLKQFVRARLSSKETNSDNNEDKSTPAKLFIVPFSQDEHFVGREGILDQLDFGGQRETPRKHRRHAIVGLGGVGKSQIAIEHAYRLQKHQQHISVFWIHAGSKTRFEQAYRDIAERLELPGRDDPKANVQRLVYNWLSNESNGQWHMILDNVDDGSVFFENNDVVGGVLQPPLETFLPQSRNGSILITSRNSTAANNLVDTFGKLVPVEPMEEKDSIALLKTKVPVDKCSEAELRDLAQLLEGIPLAITHAAAYIRSRPRITISVYLNLFQESEANQTNLLNDNETKDLRRDHSIRHAVLTTWQISFDQIKLTRPKAAELLALMSMFDRQSIPERLLHDDADQLLFEDSIAPLVNFSLVREQSEGGAFEMHRLVQLSTRKWVELNGQLKKWRSEAIKIIAGHFPKGSYETWSNCQILLPHVRTVISSKATDQQDLLCVATIHTNLGRYYFQKGEYIQAEPILREAIVVRETELGANHLDTFTSVSHLGVVLECQGKYDEAEIMQRRALEGYRKVLGLEHPYTLTSVSQLGIVLERQGEYKEAEVMQRRALEGREKVFGVEHPDTLTSVSKLGAMLEEQGNYKESEVMQRRALEGYRKVLGLEHPHTLTSVSQLGTVLERQGEYKEAEVMQRRALEGREKVFGVEHPDTLTSVSKLGVVLHRQGKHNEAEVTGQRALEGYRKVLGVEHPYTLTAMSNIAHMLMSQRRNEEAISLMEACVQLRERVLGHHHPGAESSRKTLNGWRKKDTISEDEWQTEEDTSSEEGV